jgi:hypothetical protein
MDAMKLDFEEAQSNGQPWSTMKVTKIVSGKRTHPVIRKGMQLTVRSSAACWIDLLGYGAQISKADFNPLRDEAAAAIVRLRRFHEIVAHHAHRHYPTLVMNDGAAAYRDLSLRSRSATYDFLCRSWDLFGDIRRAEEADGLPGSRMVLATGFRVLGRRNGLDASVGHFRSIWTRYQNGQISAEHAIREAARMRPAFDVVPQLQANFAFTKAYVAESSGSKGGLGGPKFFLDLSLFKSSLPDWIRASRIIDWQHDRLGLTAKFAEVSEISRKGHIQGGPLEIRDGLQVAENLTGDKNVLDALRQQISKPQLRKRRE